MRRGVGLRVGIVVAALAIGAFGWALKPAAAEPVPARQVDYRVGFLGAPCHPHVEWNDANLERLKALGFNCIQLNIAWGYRPNDEPLNLEDVVALPAGVAPMPGDTDRAPIRTAEKIAARSAELTKRIALCRKHGLRTIFHFGAPNVFYPPQDPDKPLDLCIADGHSQGFWDLNRRHSRGHGPWIRLRWRWFWEFVSQFFQQFHARIAFDRVVVEMVSDAAFKFLELGKRQGVLTGKNQLVKPGMGAQLLQQMPVFRAPCRRVRAVRVRHPTTH